MLFATRKTRDGLCSVKSPVDSASFHPGLASSALALRTVTTAAEVDTGLGSEKTAWASIQAAEGALSGEAWCPRAWRLGTGCLLGRWYISSCGRQREVAGGFFRQGVILGRKWRSSPDNGRRTSEKGRELIPNR